MHVLFVHGMGRSGLSGWPLLRRLKEAGFDTSTFGYMTSRETFAEIVQRLTATLSARLEGDELVVIGHSLGGVLLRAALSQLPINAKQPRHLFLLGSPQRSAHLARTFGKSPVFRVLTRDCGRLLGSDERMTAVPAVSIATTSIVGVSGPTGRFSPFKHSANDGVVSVSEVSADWLQDQVFVPILHTVMPSSRHIATMILQKLASPAI
jgi:pimeloyl-ACP methyl ester carboxylesterase